MSEYQPAGEPRAELPPLERAIRVAAGKALPLINHLQASGQVLDRPLWLPSATEGQPQILGQVGPWHTNDSTLPSQCYLYFAGEDRQVHTTVRAYIQSKAPDLPGVALELDNGPDEPFGEPSDEQVMMCARLLSLAGDVFHFQRSEEDDRANPGLVGRVLAHLGIRGETAA